MAKNGTLAKSQELQPSFQTTTELITIGIDLGDRFSHCCVLGPDGKVLTEGRLRSTPETMARHFQDLGHANVRTGREKQQETGNRGGRPKSPACID
jgi:hypothetical protein